MSVMAESGEVFTRGGSKMVPVRITILDAGEDINRRFVERRVIARALLTTGILSETVRNPVGAAREFKDRATIVHRNTVSKGPGGITRVADFLVRVNVDEGEG